MTGPAADRGELRWVDPSTLDPDAGNPRTIDPENRARLREVLDTFGFVENLVVNTRTGELVSGHQRRSLALELGIAEVPVLFVDLDEPQAKALSLALNADDAQGTWEPELLAIRLDELRTAGALDLVPFDTSTLRRFGIDDEGETEQVTFAATRGRDPRPEARPEDPETEPGDVWELGDHRIVCADAFELDVEAFAGGKARLLVTDPPFAIFGSSTGVAADVSDDRMVRPFFQAVARQGSRFLEPHAHAYVHCDWRSWAALWEGFRLGGLIVRNMLIWDKGDAGLGSNYANSHELVAFAHYVPKVSNTFDNRRDSTYRPVYASNIIRANRVTGADRLHNAAKPISLTELVIGNSTEPGDLVVDLFGGSGPVLIAAENLDRRAIVVDIDPGWVDVIVGRWRTLTGKRGRRRKGAALDYQLSAPIHAELEDAGEDLPEDA